MPDISLPCRVEHAAITCTYGRSDSPGWGNEQAEVRHTFTVEVRVDALGTPADQVLQDPPMTGDGWTSGACLTLTAYEDARRPIGADGRPVTWALWLEETAGLTTAIPRTLDALLGDVGTAPERTPATPSSAPRPAGRALHEETAGDLTDAPRVSGGRGLLADSVVLWIRTVEVHPALRGTRLGHRLLAHATTALRIGPGDLALLEAAPVPTRYDPPFDPPPLSIAARRARRVDGVRMLTRYYAQAGYFAVSERFTGARELKDPQILVQPLGDEAVEWCTRLGLLSNSPSGSLL